MSLFIYHTHTHSLGYMSEREVALSSEREREKLWISYFLFLGFTAAIGAHFISEEVTRFSPLWFLQGKYLSLVSCDYCFACYSLR